MKKTIRCSIDIKIPDNYSYEERRQLWNSLKYSGSSQIGSDGSSYNIRTDKIKFKELKHEKN